MKNPAMTATTAPRSAKKAFEDHFLHNGFPWMSQRTYGINFGLPKTNLMILQLLSSNPRRFKSSIRYIDAMSSHPSLVDSFGIIVKYMAILIMFLRVSISMWQF